MAITISKDKKEQFKQGIYRMIEFRYYLKYRKRIPKGIRRVMIEIVIALGQLTVLYDDDRLENIDVVNNVFDIATERNNYINKYINYLNESKKETQ